MDTIIFEDRLTENFYPLTLTRPAFDLLQGSKSLLQEAVDSLHLSAYSLVVQRHLRNSAAKKHPRVAINPERTDGQTLFLNALARTDHPELQRLISGNRQFLVRTGETVVAARLNRSEANQLLAHLTKGEKFSASSKGSQIEEGWVIRYPWQLVEQNPHVLGQQLPTAGSRAPPSGIEVRGPRRSLFLDPEVILEKPVFFDTREGPILVGSGTEIQAFTRIEGPAYIGRGALVKSAQIRRGTTIGEGARIGGEIEQTIFSAYSNKAHSGYVGHSYVGEWVNLGADTTVSNLKNTYGTVRMEIQGKQMDTGNIKVGCFIADNVKTAIGTLIYSGKTVGVAAHLYSVITENTPSFTINAKSLNQRPIELTLQSAIETQARMMARRGVTQTEEDRALLTEVFRMTQLERYGFGALKEGFRF